MLQQVEDRDVKLDMLEAKLVALKERSEYWDMKCLQ